MKEFKLKNPDGKFPKNVYYQLSSSKELFLPDPMEVKGKSGKYLWQERLEECQKTNPEITFEDMCWGLADIPDEFIVKGKNKFK